MKINAIMKKMMVNASMAILVLVMVTSCKSKVESLADALPADMDLVLVGDVGTIVEAMDGSINGSTIKLPSYITDLLNEESSFNSLLSHLKNSGIDMETCAIAGNYKDPSPVIVFALDNEKQFVSFIESEDYVMESENDGMTIYNNRKEYRSNQICIYQSFAYYVEGGYRDDGDDYSDSERFFSEFISSVAETSFASTEMGKYILEGNVGGVSFIIPSEFRNELKKAGVPSEFVDMYRGYVCCKWDMKENATKVSLRLFDENGNAKTAKDLIGTIDENAVISRDALSYIHSDEFMVFATSLKNFNWEKLDLRNNEYFSSNTKSDMALVKSYLERIDGTIAVGFGLENGWASSETIQNGDIVGNAVITIIAELKAGKVEATMDDIKTLLDRNAVPFENIPDGISINIPYDEDGKPLIWNIQAKENILVMSNRKIRKYNGNALDDTNLEGKNMVAVLNLRKGNSLFREFRINDELKLTFALCSKDAEYTLECELGSHGSGSFITRIFKMFNNVRDYIDKHNRRSTYNDEYEDSYDSEYSDTTVIDWEEIDSVAVYVEEAYEE